MLNIYSWRWSQILRRSAVKRVLTHIDQLFFLVIFETLIIGAYVMEYSNWFYEPNFGYFITALLIFDLIMVICTADCYYVIKDGSKKYYRIYLYNAGAYSGKERQEMVILNNHKEYQIRAEITPDYHFYRSIKGTAFLFHQINDDNWMYISGDDIISLGTRLNKYCESVYTQTDNKMVILDIRGLKALEADVFFMNGAFIPPLAAQNIYDADTEEKLNEPQDFLIAKQDKCYTVYGIYDYLAGNDAPQCRILKMPYLIFKEGIQEVLLQWNEQCGYRELYRTRQSVKRNVDDTFVELTFQSGIGGTVKKFDEKTGNIKLIYQGCFHAIDFGSGAVIGDNGFEYTP